VRIPKFILTEFGGATRRHPAPPGATGLLEIACQTMGL
jgi:hypothetical protein